MKYLRMYLPAVTICLVCMVLYGCHKKKDTPAAKTTVEMFVFHHSDSLYRNVNYTTTKDTIYSTGTYADTTMPMTALGTSTIIFNADTLSLDSTVAGVSYYHYNGPVFSFNPYVSYFTQDSTGQMSYFRRTHIAASATDIEHLWR